MPDIHAKVEISPELQRLINNSGEMAPKAIKEGMKRITREAPKQVRQRIRSLGLVRKGNLVKTIRGRTRKDSSVIGTKYFVGHILEGGAKPHIIKAKRGKTLFFAGRNVKKVRHPGVRPYKFLEGTIGDMESSGQISSLFAQGVQEAIEAIQNG